MCSIIKEAAKLHFFLPRKNKQNLSTKVCYYFHFLSNCLFVIIFSFLSFPITLTHTHNHTHKLSLSLSLSFSSFLSLSHLPTKSTRSCYLPKPVLVPVFRFTMDWDKKGKKGPLLLLGMRLPEIQIWHTFTYPSTTARTWGLHAASPKHVDIRILCLIEV